MIATLNLAENITVVGLGAFLGGYFSFATQAFIQDRTRDRERQKELRERLYSITIKLSKSFESITHYIASTIVFNNNPTDEIAKQKYETADDESMADWKGLLSIPAELKMLGFKRTSTIAREYFILLSQSTHMIDEIVTTGKNDLQIKMEHKFESLMVSIETDYHNLFKG